MRYIKKTLEIELGPNSYWEISVTPSHSHEPGRWTVEVLNLNTGGTHDVVYSNGDTMDEAIGHGMASLPEKD